MKCTLFFPIGEMQCPLKQSFINVKVKNFFLIQNTYLKLSSSMFVYL